MSALVDPVRCLTPDEREQPSPAHRRVWTVVTTVEVVAACGAIVLDLAVPSLVLLAMAAKTASVPRGDCVDQATESVADSTRSCVPARLCD